MGCTCQKIEIVGKICNWSQRVLLIKWNGIRGTKIGVVYGLTWESARMPHV